jgi:hypothetical protein
VNPRVRFKPDAEAGCGEEDVLMEDKNRRGPKTERGKAIVRLNPVKHGVLSQTPVIPLIEKQEDWERLRAGVIESVKPVGLLEELYADRIAGLFWRLYRTVRLETEAISGALEEVPADWRLGRGLSGLPPIPEVVTEQHVAEMERMLMKRLIPNDEVLNKVMRYETKLHRYLLQTMHQLLLLQGLRKVHPRRWEGVPSVDPTGLPGGTH